ncbi:DUF2972 domain-containing protein, partial [Campylobacter cuniculorum]
TFLLQHLNPKQKQEFIKLLFSLPNSNSLLKEFKELFEEFKDYEALLVVLKHNISFHLQFINNNLTLIKEWLHSKEFKEKYLDTKHPYPSLLNPLKLDYESVDAELAWDMNVPLPDLYQFIFVLIHGAGTTSMTHFLRLCGVSLNRHWGNADFQYKQSYQMLLNNKNNYNAIIVSGSNFDGRRDKMIALCDKSCPVLCVVRDPISVFKHLFNHRTFSPSRDKYLLDKQPLRNFGLETPMQDLFDFEIYTRIKSLELSVQIQNHAKANFPESLCRINHFLNQASRIYYIPMENILPPKTYDTLLFLSKELGFNKPQRLVEFERRINSANYYSNAIFFPKIFKILNSHNNPIHLEITLEQNGKEKDFVECIKLFSQSIFLIDKIKARVYCLKEQFILLNEEKNLLDKVKSYLKEYFIKMEEFYREEETKLINEKDILEEFKKDKTPALIFKRQLDKEYAHLKQVHPDIVASWNYYNEFEKICEEFDKH